MSKSVPRRDLTHLGMDVSKDWIVVGVLRPGEDVADVDKVFHDEVSVRRLVERLGGPRRLWACYEAGPTGYELHRLLTSVGVACDVVAPSLIPRAAGDRVKTDRRDCRRLARLHRAGELTAIRVPTPAEEGVRDLARARLVAVEDRRRARQRLSSFLLRHSVVWRDGSAWTQKHVEWLRTRRFEDSAVAAAYAFYRAEVITREATVDAIAAELEPWCTNALFADAVRRLSAYRGIDRTGALALAAEVCDWRRFAHARDFMGFSGLVPSEYSSGESVRRGHITCAGNVHVRTQLIESAWAYQHRPNVSLTMTRRHDGLDPAVVARAWKAQLRLCGRWRRLAARKDSKNTVTAAIARELAGFVWAEMTA